MYHHNYEIFIYVYIRLFCFYLLFKKIILPVLFYGEIILRYQTEFCVKQISFANPTDIICTSILLSTG